ncbi:hypothetical protein [Yoonia sp. 208BN28-4]|uniref:hypothetical protein n=1 Tax=Yoonia sp. 208BN28-4 TaxID=3126505 RepID=UPI0030985BE6
MYKTFMAGLTALSLTLAPAPAAADINEREVGQLLFGLVVAGIIGKAISDTNRRDNDRREEARQAPVQERHDTLRPLRPQQPAFNDRLAGARDVLPSSCLRRHDTQRGVQRIFGQRCLERNYRHARSLPDQCQIRLRTYDGPRQGYAPSCLRDFGYRIDRRNH